MDKIRFDTLPTVSEDADISGTIVAVQSNNTILSGVLADEATEADDQVSRLLTLTHTSDSSVEYRIIADSDISSTIDATGAITGVTSQLIFQDSSLTGKSDDYYNNFVVKVTFAASGNTETRTISDYTDATGEVTVSVAFTETLVIGDTISIECGTILPNGTFDTDPVAGDTFSITSNYFIAEGLKKLTRFTAVGNSSPLPDEWTRLLVDGLRYYGELQSDQDSAQSVLWRNQYYSDLQDWVDYHGQPRGDQRRTVVDTSGISSL